MPEGGGGGLRHLTTPVSVHGDTSATSVCVCDTLKDLSKIYDSLYHITKLVLFNQIYGLPPMDFFFSVCKICNSKNFQSQSKLNIVMYLCSGNEVLFYYPFTITHLPLATLFHTGRSGSTCTSDGRSRSGANTVWSGRCRQLPCSSVRCNHTINSLRQY